MAQFTYRLQLLLEQREAARNTAQQELMRTEQERDAQVQSLRSLEQRQQDLTERREQLRREVLAKTAQSAPLTAKDAQDRFEYVKFLGAQIEEAKQAVVAQRGVVKQWEERVREANLRLEKARREVEVLTKHRSRQEERFARDAHSKEEQALDEIGNVLYTARRHAR